ncbi:Ohr family peroxiredoxin [Microbacterium trichothecenolyticum]|uniref:Osmotically inducible protein OsmC n=1 Tax=Microbacterium trichothecenolyticum TaxID=69370 RepID=A0ABU0TT33_MICTR|nr:Ohr family peroxiredoxin [Microbacterium trichothecenolyticum]MDQ1122827.1 osmotically inducible protein OsmC [Microbacterium trichothecenolyticum]
MSHARITKTLYRTRVTSTNDAQPRVTSDDGRLDLDIGIPVDLGGPGGDGTDPQQLFGAALAKCFGGILPLALDDDSDIDPTRAVISAEVAIGPSDIGFAIAVRLEVHLPGVDLATAQELVERTRRLCPYSRLLEDRVDFTAVAV